MSPQVKTLDNLIRMARRTGKESTVRLIRTICIRAAEKAPATDLLTIAECLVGIGKEATETEARRN